MRPLPRWRQRWPPKGIETQRIAIDIAAHSRMLEPILAALWRAICAAIG
jgi:hypothetical protein